MSLPFPLPKISDDPFFTERCRYNCTANFFWPFFHHSFSKFSVFTPLFHSCTSNCHFTAANYILQLQNLSSVAR